jgi:hypothetical protein
MNLPHNKNKFIITILTFIFVFTSVFSFFPTKKAEAVLPVIDVKLIEMLSGIPTAIPTADVNPFSIKNLAKMALKRLLRQLTMDIVAWIDSGFSGNPAFITDTGQFLMDTADITIGDFIMNDPSLDFLCDPFKLQVKLALGLQYRPFKEQIKCRFTDVLGNTNEAMNTFLEGDFIGGGGWDTWLQITTIPQNNQMGAMILAQSELDARIETNKNIQLTEANWGGGFMSWKECTNLQTGEKVNSLGGLDTENTNTVDEYGTPVLLANAGPSNVSCTIRTPGGLIANKINWVDTSTLRELELADDINAIMNALLNQLITEGMKIFSEGGLLGSNSSKANTSHQDLMNYLDQIQTQAQTNNNNGNNGNSNGNSVEFQQNTTSNFITVPQASATVDRDTPLQTIAAQIAIENQYFTAQNNIFNLLNTAQNIFASSTCSEFTRNYLTSQITGVYTGQKDLIWNKIDINNAINLTSNNIAILSTAQQQINSANTNAEIQNIVNPLNNLTTLHTGTAYLIYSPGGATYTAIINWLVDNINVNRSCVGDVSALSGWGIQ